MGNYDRSIKIAFDNESGKILEADKVLSESKDAFTFRKEYHEKKIKLSCCECGQDLIVSGSKFGRIHFKHKPGHSYCFLSDDKITPQEHEKFTEISRLKESDRHKYLKNKIGELLRSVHGVDLGSIAIDDKCIIKTNGRRRPDVYCRYKEKELVFEIQLSDLSLSYILNRYNFYKDNEIYLIWILDNFDIHKQGTLERETGFFSSHWD